MLTCAFNFLRKVSRHASDKRRMHAFATPTHTVFTGFGARGAPVQLESRDLTAVTGRMALREEICRKKDLEEQRQISECRAHMELVQRSSSLPVLKRADTLDPRKQISQGGEESGWILKQFG